MRQEILVWGVQDDLVLNGIRKYARTLWISAHKEADIGIFHFFKGSFLSYEVGPFDPAIYRDLIEIKNNNFQEIYLAFSRHYKECVQYLEIETILDECIKFLAKILKNKSAVVFSNIPHEGPDILIYYYALKRKIPRVIFYQSLFPEWSFLLKEYYPDFIYYENEIDDEKLDVEAIRISTWYMRKGTSWSKKLKLIFKVPPRRYKDLILFNFRHKKLHALPERYVAFYLHLQPEMTTSSLTRTFINQLTAIEAVHRSLPQDTWLLVKENPKQGAVGRPRIFLEKLASMDRVVYFKSSAMPNNEIVQRATFVATITGTVGWEAVRAGKPVLIFGNTWYADAPLVKRIRDGHDAADQSRILAELSRVTTGQADWSAFKELTARRAFPFCTDPAYYYRHAGFDISINAQRIVEAIRCLLKLE